MALKVKLVADFYYKGVRYRHRNSPVTLPDEARTRLPRSAKIVEEPKVDKRDNSSSPVQPSD